MKNFILLSFIAVTILFLFSCPAPVTEPEEEIPVYTVSGTLTKTGLSSGYGYAKLMAGGSNYNGTAIYAARTNAAFSSGTAAYTISGVKNGSYTICIMIDGNGDAVADGYTPDSGEFYYIVACDITSAGRTVNVLNGDWVTY